jgi:hypothetical protein
MYKKTIMTARESTWIEERSLRNIVSMSIRHDERHPIYDRRHHCPSAWRPFLLPSRFVSRHRPLHRCRPPFLPRLPPNLKHLFNRVRTPPVRACARVSNFFFECRVLEFLLRNTVSIDTHICMSIHFYKHMHVHPISMNISERLSQLDLEIYEVGHQECIVINEDVTSH